MDFKGRMLQMIQASLQKSNPNHKQKKFAVKMRNLKPVNESCAFAKDKLSGRIHDGTTGIKQK